MVSSDTIYSIYKKIRYKLMLEAIKTVLDNNVIFGSKRHHKNAPHQKQNLYQPLKKDRRGKD